MFATVVINVTDMSDYMYNTRKSYSDVAIDNKLLHEPITRDMLLHDPYTPESTDSRSPCIEKEEQNDAKALRRKSVTPQELKDRLESILQVENKRTLRRSASQNTGLDVSVKEFYRNRTMSDVPKVTNSVLVPNSMTQIRDRLQSHHSSSEEEWFVDEKSDLQEYTHLKGNSVCYSVHSSHESANDNCTKVSQTKYKRSKRNKKCCYIL